MLTRKAARLVVAATFLAGLVVAVAALGSGATGRAAGFPFRVHVPALSNDEYHAPTAPPSSSPTSPPSSTPSGNTVTLQAGRGFIFEPPTVSTDDRDVWWNGRELVPATGAAVQRVDGLDGLPPVGGYGGALVVPAPGNVFAFRLTPRPGNGRVPFAKLAVRHVAGGVITFDWRYYPGEPCEGTRATIVALNKGAQVITVQGAGDMTGWKIVSLATKPFSFSFPAAWVLNGSAQVQSAVAQFPPSPTRLWWSSLPTWDPGRNDDAQLFNCEGTLVQTFDDGQ